MQNIDAPIDENDVHYQTGYIISMTLSSNNNKLFFLVRNVSTWKAKRRNRLREDADFSPVWKVLLRSYCFYVSVMCLSCVCHPGARMHHQFKQIQTSWQSKGLRTLVALSWKSHGYTPEVLIFYFDFLHVQFVVSTVSNVYVLISDSLPEVYLESI